MIYLHRVHPTFCWGIESPTKFSKKGDLTGFQFLEEKIAGKEGRLFSAGETGCNVYIKNKLKSEVLNDKKN